MTGEQINNSGYGFAVRVDNIKESSKNTKVESGCAVTAQGTPDMTVAVASGVISVAGAKGTITGVNKTVTAAHATLDRYDIISATSGDSVVYTVGTAAAKPYPPDLPADSALLAIIFVEKASTTVENTDIADSRIIQTQGAYGFDITNGHDHDGSDSKTVAYANLTGKPIIPLASGCGTTQSTSVIELDTVSISAGQLTNADYVYVDVLAHATTGYSQLFLRVEGTDITIFTGQENYWQYNAKIASSFTLGSKLVYSKRYNAGTPPGTESIEGLGGSSMDGAYTISLRGKVGTTETLSWRWIVYAVTGV